MKAQQRNQVLNEQLKTLQKTGVGLHTCSASFKESVPVREAFEGRTAWEGNAQVFNLIDHPETDKCYTWSSPIEGSEKRKFYAILHIPPVDSSEKAVRASIIQDYRKD